jgi:NADH-quinone oxidoreductase subunit A
MRRIVSAMPFDYLPILIMIVVATALAILSLVIPHFLGPSRPNPVKLDVYESGKLPYGDARRRFPVQYYLVAMLFVLFDIEVVFLYPWAVLFRRLGIFGFLEMTVFVAILLIGYFYIWRKGALDLHR